MTRLHFFRPLPPTLALTLLALGACSDDRTVSPPLPPPPPISANAWIMLSDTNAKAGSEVLVSAFAKSDGGRSIGSFTARLLYDTLMLRVMEADSVRDDALRAVNPVPGEYRVAGASFQGIPDGLLFRVRARVVDARSLKRIGLVIDEMHSTQFNELTEALQVNDGLDELQRATPGLHVNRSQGQARDRR